MINAHKVMDPPIVIDAVEANTIGPSSDGGVPADSNEFAAVSFPNMSGAAAGQDAGDVERVLEQSRVRGHAAGYAAGLRAATAIAEERLAVLEDAHRVRAARSEARLDEAHAAVTLALAAVQRVVVPVLEQSDDSLFAAATEIAEAVIGRELNTSPDGAAAGLQRVLKSLNADDDKAAVLVRLHPHDVATLTETGQLPADLSIVADAALQPGDAVAELPDGLIDARISTALLRAKRALTGDAA